MTEKEKMLSGGLYLASDGQLERERIAAKELCRKLNSAPFSDAAAQTAILKELLGRTDGTFYITPPFWCDYGYNISIGKNFYANHGLTILDPATVTFGDNVFIGPNCGFHTAAHPIDAERRNAGLESAHPISVGNSVWFGAAVQVLPGVTIGNNVVIGAGSVVTKDIPDNCVAVGNPCRVIRTLDGTERPEV